MAASKLAMGRQKRYPPEKSFQPHQEEFGHSLNNTTFRDTFKIGGPDVVVKEIPATSFGSNLSVMQRGLKAGLNMVITHEAYILERRRPDRSGQGRLLYKYKLDYATKNNIVVWRCHDHAHSHNPALSGQGWNKGLVWKKYENQGTDRGVDPAALLR